MSLASGTVDTALLLIVSVNPRAIACMTGARARETARGDCRSSLTRVCLQLLWLQRRQRCVILMMLHYLARIQVS